VKPGSAADFLAFYMHICPAAPGIGLVGQRSNICSECLELAAVVAGGAGRQTAGEVLET
jgi:hypothetical protein